ncbi:TPA: helix-turn-helix transcriptional regulator [Bacillus pseudomycoides]|nr:helix-turn-helix transcriptional regulator [Bacillus pseudomycoides]
MNITRWQVRALRLREKMTQQEFAKHLGVSRELISSIENGYCPISKKLQVNLLQAYEFTPELYEELDRYCQVIKS